MKTSVEFSTLNRKPHFFCRRKLVSFLSTSFSRLKLCWRFPMPCIDSLSRCSTRMDPARSPMVIMSISLDARSRCQWCVCCHCQTDVHLASFDLAFLALIFVLQFCFLHSHFLLQIAPPTLLLPCPSFPRILERSRIGDSCLWFCLMARLRDFSFMIFTDRVLVWSFGIVPWVFYSSTCRFVALLSSVNRRVSLYS